jgi:hypothetical protein
VIILDVVAVEPKLGWFVSGYFVRNVIRPVGDSLVELDRVICLRLSEFRDVVGFINPVVLSLEELRDVEEEGKENDGKDVVPRLSVGRRVIQREANT